jgi:hypothetical protein
MPLPIDPISTGELGWGMLKAGRRWWKSQRPISRVLQGAGDDTHLVRIFVRDFLIPPGAPLLSREPQGTGFVPNVHELWPRVEGLALADVLNVLGQVGKKSNIQIVEMSKDTGLWNSHLIVLGAQAQKCFDFYDQMTGVAYRVDNREIRSKETGAVIPRDDGYGYGIILKARNPHHLNGVGILIGGYGVLGTEAAGYYFREHAATLGQLFGTDCFGVVVRASVTAGVESTERLERYDRRLA